ncbi:hypothetical protein [Sphingomonas sp. LM7]|uniref:hypothetical protein n=1 Tax=Sphingomonas sp. LM7 TaxID=1938607 RepID=UPI000983F788|nr:hypothetical protein [Sphingomonas sp. LM7]AQR74935.1 hypothetical protein BXU08_15820 [Sphingomonas sp. LM7]
MGRQEGVLVNNAIERAADLLFGDAGRSVVNVRFLCGGQDNVSAERLAEQIVLSEAQIRGEQARRITNVDEYLTSIAS